ncbi:MULTISPECIES: hypothetical protein [Streptomyces violaceusniger group]|uniref:Uncharacterized protein n=1 Tax=Streptomyces violaceusniger TaxID=68280 RepID=A0A4D4L8B2_STRVO|nr:hypothetical protein [Streptomyces sp. SPMA113]GDY56654.1 hypothetical protein SVIO_072770 [Streptomyces violaceusniger]
MHSEGGKSDDSASWAPHTSQEWYAARDAAAALRDVLTAAGMQREFPYLRADLNAFGHGLIELGRVSPETAERLAELLRRAISCPNDLRNQAQGRKP